MEVHPPDHPIHTWRDFFVHIATIVIGLLIAIGLEQTVEWFHHRHLVHTAHIDLRSEMSANGATLQVDDADLQRVRGELLADLQNLRAIGTGKPASQARMTAQWRWEGLSDSAFVTARDTGAFAFMPYEEVQHLDTVYRQQQLVGDAATTYIVTVNRIRLPLQDDRALPQLSREDVQRMMDGCSEALLDINLLQALMRPLHKDYDSMSPE